jgi:hypothetical protein
VLGGHVRCKSTSRGRHPSWWRASRFGGALTESAGARTDPRPKEAGGELARRHPSADRGLDESRPSGWTIARGVTPSAAAHAARRPPRVGPISTRRPLARSESRFDRRRSRVTGGQRGGAPAPVRAGAELDQGSRGEAFEPKRGSRGVTRSFTRPPREDRGANEAPHRVHVFENRKKVGCTCPRPTRLGMHSGDGFMSRHRETFGSLAVGRGAGGSGRSASDRVDGGARVLAGHGPALAPPWLVESHPPGCIW